MKDYAKAIVGVVAIVVVVAIVAPDVFSGFSASVTGAIPGGVDPVTQCGDPNDNKVDLNYQYENADADTETFVITDVRVMKSDGTNILDATDATYTSNVYNTSANRFNCNDGPYAVYLGDESEEYFVISSVNSASMIDDPVYVSAQGSTIGDLLIEGEDDGTKEATINISVGTSANTDLTIVVSSNRTDSSVQAQTSNGLIIGIAYNDTLYGGSTGYLRIPSLTEIECPTSVNRESAFTNDDNADGVTKCWATGIRKLSDDDGEQEFPVTLKATADPTGGVDGGTGVDSLQVLVFDANHYYDNDDSTMKGPAYGDEDYADLGNDETHELTLVNVS